MARLIRRSKLIDGVPPKSYYVPKRERLERHAAEMREHSRSLKISMGMREYWRKRKEAAK